MCFGSGNCTRMPWVSGSPVEAGDEVEQVGLGHGGVEVVLHGAHAHLLAGLALAADVDRRGRVVTDANHRQAGDESLPGQLPHLVRHFRANLGRDLFSVDDHEAPEYSRGSAGAGEHPDARGGAHGRGRLPQVQHPDRPCRDVRHLRRGRGGVEAPLAVRLRLGEGDDGGPRGGRGSPRGWSRCRPGGRSSSSTPCGTSTSPWPRSSAAQAALRAEWSDLLGETGAREAAERGLRGVDLDVGGEIECPACGHKFTPAGSAAECPDCGLALGAPADASPDEAEH